MNKSEIQIQANEAVADLLKTNISSIEEEIDYDIQRFPNSSTAYKEAQIETIRILEVLKKKVENDEI